MVVRRSSFSLRHHHCLGVFFRREKVIEPAVLIVPAAQIMSPLAQQASNTAHKS